ncbi:Isoprenylcysteine carboxyl methyltransferase (ICMT) family protein [Pirellula sp. SH-Sr6A]|uniref:methyltransferase family protein n=1 Tax=Pirellula sp. SH-Sr6A TaxID=1632865 RepID=UPI00078E1D62|nr:isoprenylcysteine carboxylmethyltransferase family protein [Pirellula sp. SH-Sr6A]AMV33145.1 Isoprenylcysteine carboxyl methyltransferase (ICMT) family protein [Pirellula sp. SH-Sr6A]
MLLELPYRAAILILLGIAIASIVPAKRASSTNSRREDQPRDTIGFFLAIQSCTLLLVASTAAYMIYPTSVAWASLPIPSLVRWVGMLVGLPAIALFIWSLRHLGKSLTGTASVRSGGELVTSGPYHWVRHPYYVATAGLMTGVCLLAANGLLALGCALLLVLLAARLPQEEQALREAYGERYAKYAEQTGRFFPRVTKR